MPTKDNLPAPAQLPKNKIDKKWKLKEFSILLAGKDLICEKFNQNGEKIEIVKFANVKEFLGALWESQNIEELDFTGCIFADDKQTVVMEKIADLLIANPKIKKLIIKGANTTIGCGKNLVRLSRERSDLAIDYGFNQNRLPISYKNEINHKIPSITSKVVKVDNDGTEVIYDIDLSYITFPNPPAIKELKALIANCKTQKDKEVQIINLNLQGCIFFAGGFKELMDAIKGPVFGKKGAVIEDGYVFRRVDFDFANIPNNNISLSGAHIPYRDIQYIGEIYSEILNLKGVKYDFNQGEKVAYDEIEKVVREALFSKGHRCEIIFDDGLDFEIPDLDFSLAEELQMKGKLQQSALVNSPIPSNFASLNSGGKAIPLGAFLSTKSSSKDSLINPPYNPKDGSQEQEMEMSELEEKQDDYSDKRPSNSLTIIKSATLLFSNSREYFL